MIVNKFIITIDFGGRGALYIRGRVLFCSNNAASDARSNRGRGLIGARDLIGARGLIEEIRYM